MAMKDLKTILEECSINDIYFSNRGTSILYKIPIYQRNYAWEREEIRALINDVYDSMTKSVYYIGTLVTYKRDENIYEVIDGQQRLTTIYIILKALGIETIGNHLTYSARKISATTIEKMPKFSEEKDQGIVDGFNYAKEALKNIVVEDESKLDAGRIVDAVCRYYNIKKEELLARKRTKEIASARQVAMFLISDMLDMPLAAVGNIFGKDHATVIYAKTRVAEDMAKDKKFATEINDIRQMAKGK